MIRLLPNLPDNTIGLAASGHVTGRDYEEVVIPAVEAALGKHKKLRLLYELGNDLTGFAPAAMWDDMKLGMSHLSAWERIAVVTDIEWIANATNIFRLAMPCPVKVFPLGERCFLLLILALAPALADASFNSAPCRTFGCHFMMAGVLGGMIGGLPISGLIFIGLHMGFAHPRRSKVRQLFLGGFVGLVAFEIAAAAGALYTVTIRGAPGWQGFLAAYVLLAILSALYARSAPRSAPEGD